METVVRGYEKRHIGCGGLVRFVENLCQTPYEQSVSYVEWLLECSERGEMFYDAADRAKADIDWFLDDAANDLAARMKKDRAMFSDIIDERRMVIGAYTNGANNDYK